MKLFRAWILFSLMIWQVNLVAQGAKFPEFVAGRSTVSFTNRVVQAGPDEVKWRLHAIEEPGRFDIARERFQLIVPTNYTHTEPWGVLVWISAGDTPAIPADWEPVLAQRRLLFIGAFNSGNPRNIFDRVRMALHANVGLRERFNVDTRRVYVSGFSGGARVASMVGVAWADMFNGTLPFMGVNFYTDLPGERGGNFGASFIPDDEVLAIAKSRCRYVLVTGERDFNRLNTRTVYEQGYRREKFNHAHYLEIPGQGHALPSARWFASGLDLLDGRKPPATAGR